MAGTLITTQEVAACRGVTKWVVKTLVDKGQLKALRLGHKTIRFDERDVDAYIRRLRRRS